MAARWLSPSGSLLKSAYMSTVLELLENISTYGIMLLSEYGPWIIIPVIFFENLFFLGYYIPGGTLLMIAGTMVYKGEMSLAVVYISAVLALYLASCVSYLTGRLLNKLNTRIPARFHKIIHSCSKYFEKSLWFLVFFRHIEKLKSFLPVSAGWLGVQPKKWFLLDLVAGQIWILTFLVIGYLVGAGVPLTIEQVVVWIVGINGVIWIAVTVYLVFQQTLKLYMRSQRN